MGTFIRMELEIFYQNFAGGLTFALIFLFLFWRSKQDYLKLFATFWMITALSYLLVIIIYQDFITPVFVLAYIAVIILAGFFLLKGVHSLLNQSLNKFWTYLGFISFGISSISVMALESPLISIIVIMLYLGLAYLYSGFLLIKDSRNFNAIGSGIIAIVLGIIITIHPYISLQERFISTTNILTGSLGALWGIGLIAIHYQDLINTLKKEKLKSDALFKNSTTAITILDDEGKIVDFNDEFEKKFGYTLSEIQGEHLDDVMEKSKKGSSSREKTREILQGKLIREEGKRFDKFGNAKEFLLHGVPIIINKKVEGVYVLYDDITDIKDRKRRLEMTKFSLDKAELLILRVDPAGIINYANDRASALLGYNQENLVDKHIKTFVSGKNYIPRDQFWEEIKAANSLTYERECINSQGEKFPLEITSQYYNYEGKEYEYVFAKDISERKEKEREIKQLLYKDPLTGLYNRRFVEEEIKRFDTKRQLPISIIMLDVNGLKVVNDSLGHKQGDQLLIKTANILKEAMRDEDILARYGGDEFVILLPQTDNEETEKIIKRITLECHNTKDDKLLVSLGIGAATKTDIETDIFDILKTADDNMYQDKLMKSKSRKHEIVDGLINALGAKSDETKEHARRMTDLAYTLAESIGLSASLKTKLSLLATLHDIGKISISEEILNKPGQLTEKEWETLKKHPENGFKIASSSTEFAAVAEEILFHHERWDGTGYPKGLKGNDIPLLSRIISIIDAYDVMTHERSYSPAVSKSEALEEINYCAGSQFDPELASKFVEIISSQEEN